MTAIKKAIIKDHTKRYIDAVMADALRQKGFASKDGIYWYRIVNNEVVHSIYFITRYTALPVDLGIGYGCHPLFIPPLFSNGPYFYGLPYGHEQIVHNYPIMKQSNRFSFASDVLVTCPADEYAGRDILEKLLEEQAQYQTAEACYQMHKERKMDAIELEHYVFNLSTHFVDEVVYWDDKEMYPVCKTFIPQMIGIVEDAQRIGRIRKVERAMLDELKLQKDFFESGEREIYLQRLREREDQTWKLLKKHVGI